MDEKNGTERRTASRILVQASDLRDAVNNLDEWMRGTMADYQIASVCESPIWEVLPYEAAERKSGEDEV